jgi:hypothetical protein
MLPEKQGFAATCDIQGILPKTDIPEILYGTGDEWLSAV